MKMVRSQLGKFSPGLAGSLSVFLLLLVVHTTTLAATTTNAQSPFGLNLMNVNYYNPEQPFLNIFKTTGVSKATGGWVTSTTESWDTREESGLQLDANGYPTTLVSSKQPQQFTSVSAAVLRGLPASNRGTGLPYRAGQYVVLYDGQGTMTYSGDAALVSSSPGRDVVNIANPTNGGGLLLRITATDPSHKGNYLRNIRIVKAEEESLLAAGNVFRPGFLSLLQNFRMLRFLQWFNTDAEGGNLTSWASRPQLTDGGWGSVNGVPIEVAVQLCNATGSDCWLNVPHQASADYVNQMAALVHRLLGSGQKVYVEFSNEVWNGAYAQYNYAIAQGRATWPGANASNFTYNRNWYGMKAAQTCDAWKAAWGADAARVHCVLAAQEAAPSTATTALDCALWSGTGNAPCAKHGISEVAVSDYLFVQAPQSWTTLSDGGLTNLFAEINEGGQISGDYPGGALKQTANWSAAFHAAIAPYNLPMVAYEGGQSLVSWVPETAKLYAVANRDPRMGSVYKEMLSNWKANGGTVYNIYADIYSPGLYGEWGALESFLDTVSPLSAAPPKWQAIQSFIDANPCWWAGCSGTVGSSPPPAPLIPQPPANLQVH